MNGQWVWSGYVKLRDTPLQQILIKRNRLKLSESLQSLVLPLIGSQCLGYRQSLKVSVVCISPPCCC